MPMSSKHYNGIAAIISRTEDDTERKRLARELAEFCKADNPRLDRERFIAACRVILTPEYRYMP